MYFIILDNIERFYKTAIIRAGDSEVKDSKIGDSEVDNKEINS